MDFWSDFIEKTQFLQYFTLYFVLQLSTDPGKQELIVEIEKFFDILFWLPISEVEFREKATKVAAFHPKLIGTEISKCLVS